MKAISLFYYYCIVIYFSLKQCIRTAALPSSIPPIPSPLFSQRREDLQGTQTEHVTWPVKTTHKSSHQGWTREPNRRKGVWRAVKIVRDIPTVRGQTKHVCRKLSSALCRLYDCHLILCEPTWVLLSCLSTLHGMTHV